MPHIGSQNPDSNLLQVPSTTPNYSHGVDSRREFVPVAFQITSPFNNRKALLPHALVLHVNPESLAEKQQKKVERFATRGGFVEQHWPDELAEISADGSTGAFMNIYTGLASVHRQKTIAWDRYRDLQDLYRNNGSVYDPYGNIVLQGNVMLMFDRATYIGYFHDFRVEETEDKPYSFKISWTFKIEETILKIPGFAGAVTSAPVFQKQNSSIRVTNG